MSIRKIAGALALSGVLAGCAVGPDYRVPDLVVPAGFLAQGGQKASMAAAPSADLSQWWRALRDPELNALIERALAANLDLKIALDRLQQARMRLVVIGSQALPQVNAGAGGGVGTGSDETRGRVAQPVRDGETSTGLSSINEAGGLDAEWELDIFGKISRRVEAQTYSAEGLEEARAWVYVEVAADVARLYIDLRARQQRLEVLNRNIDAARTTLNLAQTRFDRGLTNEMDVTFAKRQVAALQADVAPLVGQIASSRYGIAVLLGEYPEALASELRRPAPIPAMPARVPLGVPVDLLRRRPDIREAERFVAAATAEADAAIADLFPSVILTAGGGAEGGRRSSSAIPVTWIGSVGPSVYAPILDFGALDARIEIADLRTHELLQVYKQRILAAVQQVDDADGAYRGLQQSLRKLDIALDAARQATKIASERYDRGLTDFLNVLDAERQQYELEQRRVETLQLEGDSLVALYKALGGGWPRDQLIPPLRRPDPAAVAAVKHLLTPDPAVSKP